MGCIQRKSQKVSNQSFIRSLAQLNKDPSINSSSPLKAIINPQIFNEAKTGKKLSRTKTPSDLFLIKSCLNKSIIFSNLKEDQISQVSVSMSLIEVKQGEIIIEQNTPGQMFFIINQGTVEVLLDNKRVNILKVGDSFGEIALIQDSLRTSSVVSFSNSQLWVISRDEFKNLLGNINAELFEENKGFLRKLSVFSDVSEAQMELIINSVVQMKFVQNSKILRINQQGESLYVIKEGIVSCIVKGEEKKRLHQGDYFGEISLLTNAPRNASVVAMNNVTCLMITKHTLNIVFEGNFHKILYHNIILEKLSSLKSLSILQKSQLKTLASQFQIQKCADCIVIPKDTLLASNIWIILNGSCKINNEELEKYSFLGIQELINSSTEVLQSDVLAYGECEIGVLPANKFLEILENDYKVIEEVNNAIQIFKKKSFFKKCNFSELQKLVRDKKTKKFSAGDTLLKAGIKAEQIILVKNGKVRVGNVEKKIEGKIFGINESFFGLNVLEDVVCVEDCDGYAFDVQEIEGIFEENILEVVKARFTLKNLKVTSSDLTIVGKLATQKNKSKYICKLPNSHLITVSPTPKSQIIPPLKTYLQQELQACKLIDHVLISPILTSFTDNSGLYLLSEHISSIPLSDQIQVLNSAPESIYIFYFSCLTEIIHYLSDHQLIHRDLTMDHFVIDAQGYINLTNTTFLTHSQNRTFTILSSPYYTAPEVINNKGYTEASMFWTLGILLFEMICKEVPFGNKENDPYVVYEKILKKRIIYPSVADKYLESQKIVEQLLCKNPAMRMPGGMQKFKIQSYFEDVSWKELVEKKIKPPVLPEIPQFVMGLLPGPLIAETTQESPPDWNNF